MSNPAWRKKTVPTSSGTNSLAGNADASAQYTVYYNAPVEHSQIQQGSPHATQTMTVTGADVEAIKDFIKEHAPGLGLPADSRLWSEVQKVEAEVIAASPSGKALQTSLRAIRGVLENCAGSLIASGLIHEIGKLVP